MNLTPRVFWMNLRGGYAGKVHVAVGPWKTACGLAEEHLHREGTEAPVTCLRCLAATGQTGEILGEMH